MHSSILKEFFHGNISPESQSFKHDSRYREVMRVICKAEEKLLEQLNGEEKEVFKVFSDAQMELTWLTAINSQIYGYKLGVTMTAEAFITGRELVTSA